MKCLNPNNFGNFTGSSDIKENQTCNLIESKNRTVSSIFISLNFNGSVFFCIDYLLIIAINLEIPFNNFSAM